MKRIKLRTRIRIVRRLEKLFMKYRTTKERLSGTLPWLLTNSNVGGKRKITNSAHLALSKAIKQNNYAAIQIERGNCLEARQVLPNTLYSLKQLLCSQNIDESPVEFFDGDSYESDQSSNSESVDENDLSISNHSKLESSRRTAIGPVIADNSNVLASCGYKRAQPSNVYRTPIHLDHDCRLQQALLSKAEETAIVSSSAAAVIFNLALALHLSGTRPGDGSNSFSSSNHEAHQCMKWSCLVKAESLYILAMELVLHNMMPRCFDAIDGKLLLAVLNNLGAVRVQINDHEAALVSFQYLMNTLMLMVDRGIVLGIDCEWFFGNALMAEHRFRITPLVAAAA